jgi:hypothetical protein
MQFIHRAIMKKLVNAHQFEGRKWRTLLFDALHTFDATCTADENFFEVLDEL